MFRLDDLHNESDYLNQGGCSVGTTQYHYPSLNLDGTQIRVLKSGTDHCKGQYINIVMIHNLRPGALQPSWKSSAWRIANSQWVSVTTLPYFSVLYDSHIYLCQALKMIYALQLVHWRLYKLIRNTHLKDMFCTLPWVVKYGIGIVVKYGISHCYCLWCTIQLQWEVGKVQLR